MKAYADSGFLCSLYALTRIPAAWWRGCNGRRCRCR